MLEYLQLAADFLPLAIFLVIKPIKGIYNFVKSIDENIKLNFDDHKKIIAIISDHENRLTEIEKQKAVTH